MKLIENIGDGFAYVILHAKNINNIPRRRNPVNVVRYVLRPRHLTSSYVPRYIKEFDYFKFCTETGEELLSDEEMKPHLRQGEIKENTLIPIEAVPKTASHVQSSFQSQSSESLTALDVDMLTILEE